MESKDCEDFVFHELSAVVEVDELTCLLENIAVSEDLASISRDLRTSKEIFAKYQEFSQLLDPHLEAFMKPLAAALRTEAEKGKAAMVRRVQFVSRAIEALSSTRGWKTVVRFFPNDAACFEPATFLLLKVEAEATDEAEAGDDQGGVWEAVCALLLWLSLLALIPFDLSTVDTSLSDPGASGPTLVDTIIEKCKGYLRSPGKVRDMAGLLLARLLTRPDTAARLRDFADWSEEALQGRSDEGVFLVPAIASTLAYIFKFGSRDALLPLAPKVWALAASLTQDGRLAGHTLARKLAVKLLQRVALTFLEPRVPAWRHERSSRRLEKALGAESDGGASAAAHSEDGGGRDERNEEMEERFEVAEEIEEALELLLQGLRDKDTVVRWSSAKGIGRVTARLPQDLGDDVVGFVFEILEETESDSAWHGGCLAVAELVRRGLLLPARLPEAGPLVVKALGYDVRRGPHSVGANVRDAAAYVCWAFARAYEPEALGCVASMLAPALVTMACYDREVNCRRAAAAAFQEMVGRHGSYPHGIEVTTAADYFSLSSRTAAYLSVAPFVAGFEEYRRPLADHLLRDKLRHWERPLRRLAASGLGALAPTEPEYFEAALPGLVGMCLDKALEVRHGACLGLGEVVLALSSAGRVLPEEDAEAVAGVVLDVERARLYRGKGGELMRSAACRLLECTALAGIPVSKAQRRKLLDSLDEHLRHPSAEIQSAAAAALRAFSRAYMSSGAVEAAAERTAVRYAGLLRDANPAARRGAALAIGALPRAILEPRAEQTLEALCSGLEVEEDPDERDPEARANCARAVSQACAELGGPGGPLGPGPLDRAAGRLLAAMDDYSTDNRGDVGSWVREAAMEALRTVCGQLAAHAGSPADRIRQRLAEAAAAMLKQAVERIGRVREAALRSLRGLLDDAGSADEGRGIPAFGRLRSVVDDSEALERISTGESLYEIAALMDEDAYKGPIFEGCVASIGGLDKSLASAASSSVVRALGGPSAGGPEGVRLLLAAWRRHPRSRRLAVPLLKAAELFLSRLGWTGAADGLREGLLLEMLEMTRNEARGCADVSRLLACTTTICQLVGAGGAVREAALPAALALLINRFPKVRKYAAEQIYLKLLAFEAEDESLQIPALQLQRALELVAETAWDGPLDHVRHARSPLFGLLGLAEPKKLAGKAADAASRAAAVGTFGTDDSESYSTLLADAARGLGSGM